MTNSNNRESEMATTSVAPTAAADNTDELWKIVDEHLLHYGRDFVREFITSASGSYLHTASGRSIIDFSSGQMCATLRHNHAAILEAMQRSADSVIHRGSEGRYGLVSGHGLPIIMNCLGPHSRNRY